MPRFAIWCWGLAALICAMTTPMAYAQSKAQPSTNSKGKEVQSDDDVEKQVLEFVREHQPELADLLTFMQKKKAKEYKEAMRESRKVRDRLVNLKDRDPELYEVELAIWKNAAQIRLLAAAVSAKSNGLSTEDRTRLESLVKRENDLSIQRLTLEKARLESRLNQLSSQLSRRQEQADSVVAKSLKTWEAHIERSAAKPKKKESPTSP